MKNITPELLTLNMKSLRGEKLSFDEKLKLWKELICEQVGEILQNEMVISDLSKEDVDITLNAEVCKDKDKNIRKFLKILWATNIEVTSDFPAYNESYMWTTRIKFNYDTDENK